MNVLTPVIRQPLAACLRLLPFSKHLRYRTSSGNNKTGARGRGAPAARSLSPRPAATYGKHFTPPVNKPPFLSARALRNLCAKITQYQGVTKMYTPP